MDVQVRLRLMNIFSKQKVSVFAIDKCNNVAENPEADKIEEQSKDLSK